MSKKYYEFPATIRGQLFRAADSDLLHFMKPGEVLYMVTGQHVEEGRYGVRESVSQGVRPLTLDPDLYTANLRYSCNKTFDPGLLVTAGLICGGDFAEKKESKNHIAQLVEHGEIIAVGEVEATGLGLGELRFKYSLDGINTLVNLQAFAEDRLVMIRDGLARVFPDAGRLILTGPTFRTYLSSGADPKEICGAGWLIAESLIDGGLAALIQNGADVEDGGSLDDFGNISLSEKAADALRDMAVLALNDRLYPVAGALSAPEVRAREAKLSRMFR